MIGQCLNAHHALHNNQTLAALTSTKHKQCQTGSKQILGVSQRSSHSQCYCFKMVLSFLS